MRRPHYNWRKFGRAVRAYREGAGLTQQELAQYARLSRTSITNVEAGRQRVLAEDVCTIAFGLGVPAVELFGSGCA